jgi:hypothetical protein
MNDWARKEGFAGLGYVTRKQGEFGGPIAKNHGTEGMEKLYAELGLGENDGLFFAAGKEKDAAKLAGAARTRVAEELGLIEEGCFKFCWIVDFPMFEWDEDLKKVDFSHNPFSMPQGEMEALETQDPLDIKAWQYDIVCNGYELSSGAIRNHKPEIMYKAFALAGYSQEEVDANFSGAWRLRAGDRPDRDAVGGRAEHPRGHRLPDEPARAGSDDGRAERGEPQAAARTEHPIVAQGARGDRSRAQRGEHGYEHERHRARRRSAGPGRLTDGR